MMIFDNSKWKVNSLLFIDVSYSTLILTWWWHGNYSRLFKSVMAAFNGAIQYSSCMRILLRIHYWRSSLFNFSASIFGDDCFRRVDDNFNAAYCCVMILMYGIQWKYCQSCWCLSVVVCSITITKQASIGKWYGKIIDGIIGIQW